MEVNFDSYSRVPHYDAVLRNAVRLDCPALVSAALAKGANINCQFPDDWNTPLHMAITTGCQPATIECLMSHKPDYSMVSRENFTAPELALRAGMDSLGRRMIAAEFMDARGCIGHPVDAIYELLKRNSVRALQILLEMLPLPKCELIECLAKAVSKLEVMNVAIGPELELFAHLTILRFDGEEPINCGASAVLKIPKHEVDERLLLIMDGIDRVRRNYDTELCDDVDDGFLETLRMILGQLFAVKNQVEYYPVLQLEYCIAMYLAILDRKPELDLYQLVINKCLVVDFLKQFYTAHENRLKVDKRMSCEVLFELVKILAHVGENTKFKKIIHEWKPLLGNAYKVKEQVLIKNQILKGSLISMEKLSDYCALSKEELNKLKIEADAINRKLETRKLRYRHKALFKLYFKLKQMYSLQKTIRYLSVVEKIEIDSNRCCYVPMLAIQRAVQVLGETLKSTKLSPNISSGLRSTMEFISPGNILSTITKLRQFFSHEYSATKHSLYGRLRANDGEMIELYGKIRLDLLKVLPILTNIYAGNITKYYKSFLGRVFQMKSYREVQSYARTCKVQFGFKIDFDFATADVSGMGELLQKLERSYDGTNHKENIAILAEMRSVLRHYTERMNDSSVDYMSEMVMSSIGVLLLNDDLNHQRGLAKFFLKTCVTPKIYEYGAKSLIMIRSNHLIQKLLALETNIIDTNSLDRVSIIQNMMRLASAEEVDSLHQLTLSKDKFSLERSRQIGSTLKLDIPTADLLVDFDKTLAKYYTNVFALDEKYRSVKSFCKRHKLKYNNELATSCRRDDITYYRQVFDSLVLDMEEIISLPSGIETLELVSLITSFKNYQTDSPDMLAVEIILLELLEIMSVQGILTDNRTSLSYYRPIISGRNLRNYLAHDSLVYETVCRNKSPYLTIILNAICLCKYSSVELYSQAERVARNGNIIPVSTVAQWISQCFVEKRGFVRKLEAGDFSAIAEGRFEYKLRDFKIGSVLEKLIDKNSESFIRYFKGEPIPLKTVIEVLLQKAPNQVHSFYNEEDFTVRELISDGTMRANMSFYLALQHRHYGLLEELDRLHRGVYIKESLHMAMIFGNEQAACSIIADPQVYEYCNEDAPRYNHTILTQAVIRKMPKVVRLICEKSPELLERPNTAQETPLNHAAAVGCRETVRILLEHGAEIHHPLKSPILYAVKVRKDDILEMLLPTDAELRNDESLLNQLVHEAGMVDHDVLVKRLIPLVRSPTTLLDTLITASTNGNLEVVNTVLQHDSSLVNQVGTSGRTALIGACQSDSLRLAKLLLDHGADCNSPEDYPALFHAVDSNRTAFLKLFVKRNLINPMFREVIIAKLIERSKLKLALKLLQAGFPFTITANPTIFKRAHETNILNLLAKMCRLRGDYHLQINVHIMLNAILAKNQPFIKQLLSAVIPSLSRVELAKLLNGAVKVNDRETLGALIVAGCDVNQPDGESITPLAFAVTLGRSELVRILLRAGADPNRRSTGNCDTIFTAWTLVDNRALQRLHPRFRLTYPLIIGTLYKHKKIVEFLLQNGADATVRDELGFTPAYFAVYHGELDLLRSLIFRGADVGWLREFIPSETKESCALHAAARFGYLEVFQLLVEQYGFDPAFPDENRNTCLHHAITNKRCKIVEYLLEFDCWSVRDNRNQTPIDLVLTQLDDEMFKLFRKRVDSDEIVESYRGEKQRTVLHLAASAGSPSLLQTLLSGFSFDVNGTDQLGNTPIYYAVQQKDLEKVKFLLKAGATLVGPCGEEQIPPFATAAITNQLDIVELYIQDNASDTLITLRDYRSKGHNLLEMSIWRNNFTMCELMLTTVGFDVNQTADSGSTALHLTAALSSVKIAELLLRQGADIDAINGDGKTGLTVAIESGNWKVAQYLLAKGASRQNVCEFRYNGNPGMSLLHHVAANGILDSLKLLIEREFFPRSMPDEAGRTIGHYAAANNRGNIVEYLILKEFPLDLLDSDGRSALTVALEMGHLKLAKRLKTIGSSLKVVQSYNDKHSLLHTVMTRKYFDVARYLLKECNLSDSSRANYEETLKTSNQTNPSSEPEMLEKSPLHSVVERNESNAIEQTIQEYNLSTDITDSLGRTPLHYCSIFNNMDAARKLLELGATIDQEDNTHATPLINCLLNGHKLLAEYLINAGASLVKVVQYRMPSIDRETILHVVARKGFTAILHLLLNFSVFDIDVGDKDLTTPLQEAAMYGQKECVEMLLKAGANPNIVDQQDTNALTRAFLGYHEDIVHTLMKNDVNTSNSKSFRVSQRHGESLLHLATDSNLNLVETLINKIGIDVNVTDKHGRTALHYAAELGLNDAIRHLLRHGADVGIADHLQRTPVILATLRERSDSAEILFQAATHVECLVQYRQPNSLKSVLHIALDNGHYGFLIQLLSRSGFKAQVVDVEGKNILHYAIEKEIFELVEQLCSNPELLFIKDLTGNTPLDICLNRSNIETFRAILKPMTKIAYSEYNTMILENLVNHTSNELLKHYCQWLVDNQRDHVVGNRRIVSLLDSFYDEHAIQMAVMRNNVEVLRLLLVCGIDQSILEKPALPMKFTWLHVAAMNNFALIAGILMSQIKVPVDSLDAIGQSPLGYAALLQHVETARVLLRHGANVNLLDSTLRPPLATALQNNQMEMIELLIQHGADIGLVHEHFRSQNMPLSLIHFLADRGSPEVFMTLLPSTGPDCTDSFRMTPMHYAACSNRLDIIDILHEAGAAIDWPDSDGATPLMRAAFKGHVQAYRRLCQWGASVELLKNFRSQLYDNDNALHFVARKGHLAMAKILVEELQMEVDSLDNDGNTPLHGAAILGRFKMIKYLLQNNATMSIANNADTTVLHILESIGWDFGIEE
ncbi:uncharacterized protein LOC129770085 [Toxorhynchites rutilus septentrionalis]|uniref:uncharacterized protein LOC129770085 n=1 Tax=Toxorhynchites rutilus septentrionalis TaxID=329112 RepID=UPI002479C29C|nr:uncharacterized protein LOC129770085 [Toxorhynchites rutilus septentrionalis]